jgi:hypothetical protein
MLKRKLFKSERKLVRLIKKITNQKKNKTNCK